MPSSSPPADPDDPTRLVELLCAEQVQGWQRGDRTPVEVYLERHPQLHAHPQALLDLIYHEICLREQHGEQPTPAEYLQRFPAQADSLQRQFSVHRALPKGTRGGTPSPPAVNATLPLSSGA